jgi:DNA-binding PadR family transcriptional regulator
VSTYQRPLGDNQRSVLNCLKRHGYYRRGGAWIWNSHSGTEKILDSLVRRGLVAITEENVRPATMRPVIKVTYRLTEAGQAWVSA